MLTRLTRKIGFTIAEILVALSILAILAAVLIPSLSSHVIRSDAGRIASDLTALQTAIQSFSSDVHRYPLNTTELTTALTGASNDLNGAPIPSSLQAKWKGPYVSRDVFGNIGIATLSTTFTAVVGDNSITYVAITLTGVSASDFANIEDILDSGTRSSTSSTKGSVRWTSASGGTLTFLALPLI